MFTNTYTSTIYMYTLEIAMHTKCVKQQHRNMPKPITAIDHHTVCKNTHFILGHSLIKTSHNHTLYFSFFSSVAHHTKCIHILVCPYIYILLCCLCSYPMSGVFIQYCYVTVCVCVFVYTPQLFAVAKILLLGSLIVHIYSPHIWEHTSMYA